MECGHSPEYWRSYLLRDSGWCRVCEQERGHATLEEAQGLAYTEDAVRTLIPALLSTLESDDWLAHKIWRALDDARSRYIDL